MICNKCGKEINNEDAIFCLYCGSKLEKAEDNKEESKEENKVTVEEETTEMAKEETPEMAKEETDVEDKTEEAKTEEVKTEEVKTEDENTEVEVKTETDTRKEEKKEVEAVTEKVETEETSKQDKKNIKPWIIALVALVIITGIGIFFVNAKNKNIINQNKALPEKENETVDSKKEESLTDKSEEDNKKNEKDAEDEKLESDIKSQDNKEDTKEEEVKEKVSKDPLADNKDVLYPGSKGRKAQETWDIVDFLMKEENIKAKDIWSVACSDFDGNGEYEAFIFVGTREKIESIEDADSSAEGKDEELEEEEASYTYSGSVWFSNGRNNQDLGVSSSEIWSDVDGFIDLGGRQFFMASEEYATNRYSMLWSVYNGMVQEEAVSGLGSLVVDEDGNISILSDAYDCIYDCENDILIGHSWKKYYFYYDSETDEIKEYGGVQIDPNEIEQLCGTDIISIIEKKGYYFLDAILRDNGILNINYIDYSVGSGYAEFGNVNFDINLQTYVGAFDEEGTFENSNTGGTYSVAIVPDIAVFPNKKTYESTVFATVYTYDQTFAVGDKVYILGLDADDRDVCSKRAFIIDNKTSGIHGEEADNRSTYEWIKWLSDPDEEMMANGITILGVFEFSISGPHVDNINDQLWWD